MKESDFQHYFIEQIEHNDKKTTHWHTLSKSVTGINGSFLDKREFTSTFWFLVILTKSDSKYTFKACFLQTLKDFFVKIMTVIINIWNTKTTLISLES